MPLESREDYVRLNEHLWELDPVAKEFAVSEGYEYGPPLTNGLYPKIQMWRTKNKISQYISFHMDCNDRDERFGDFFPEIPYNIFTSSWIDDLDERIRHIGPYAGIRHSPFSALRKSIREFLNYFHAHNETVTEELIYACGTKIPINGHPLLGVTRYLD